MKPLEVRRFDQYPTLRTVPEAEILPVVRVELCACGTYVRQFLGDDVRDVVSRHNDTTAHRAWRHRPEPLDGPTADTVASVDVSGHPAVRPAARWLEVVR